MRKLKPAEVACLLCTAVGVFHIGANHAQIREVVIEPPPPGSEYFNTYPLNQSPSGVLPNMYLTTQQQQMIQIIKCIEAYLAAERSLAASSTPSDPSMPYNSLNSDTYTSTRNANPDNLGCAFDPTTGTWVPQSVELQYGATGCGGGTSTEIAIFPNMADGINAAIHSLIAYGQDKSATFANWISGGNGLYGWAPASDNNASALTNIEYSGATLFFQYDPYFGTAQFTLSEAESYLGNVNLASLTAYSSIVLSMVSIFAQDEGFRKNSNECG